MEFLKLLLHALAVLGTFIVAGLICATLIAKPIYLTNDEITYYTDIAKTTWYEGIETLDEDKDISIAYDLNKKEVTILPKRSNKQSLTVNFSDSNDEVIINRPKESFLVYFIFFGLIFALITHMLINTIAFK